MAEPSVRPAEAVPPPGGERRASIRYFFSSGPQAAASLVENRWPVRVRDISATGIGMIGNRAFDIGRLVKIELQSADGARSCTLSACVVRSVPQTDGCWLIGAAFTEKLADEELQQLLR